MTNTVVRNLKPFSTPAACCIACLLGLTLCAHAAEQYYSGGTGEPNKPFKISKVADWQDLMATDTHWDRHFILTADIDFNDVPITPIGNHANNFTGVFDGNDHTLRNANMDMPTSHLVGLFGYLGSGSDIRNLDAEDVSIAGGDDVGGLVGWNFYGTISNCHLIGSVSGSRSYVGGLVGSNHSGVISHCSSAGSVAGSDEYVGGLVGDNYVGVISHCYSTGSVSGTDDSFYVAGLVGGNTGTIKNCYSAGSVSASLEVGGLVGYQSGGTITNCYSSGSVTGTYYVGGLVGSNSYGTISNCYSSGFVVGGDYDVGGLVGSNLRVVSASFWDVNTSGWTTSAGGTPKTTAEMKTQSTFSDAGWDFIEVWDIGENQTYPFLRMYAAGDINHDGIVDFRDAALLALNWLTGL